MTYSIPISIQRNVDGSVDLYVSDDVAPALCGLLTIARPRGSAEHGGLRVHVHGPSAQPQPKHKPVDATGTETNT